MSPLRKVQYFVSNCSYPLPLKGGTIEYQYLKMSPLGDLEVKEPFRSGLKYENINQTNAEK